MQLKKISIACLLGIYLTTTYSLCNSNLSLGRPDSRYVALTSTNISEVVDSQTGLSWQRCVVGMAWNGTSCIGTASSFSWVEALDYVRSINNGSLNKWRIPNVIELQTLVDRTCYGPAINSRWFDNTPAVWTWTSSPDVNQSGSAWFVDFASGASGTIANYYLQPIRLVRNK